VACPAFSPTRLLQIPLAPVSDCPEWATTDGRSPDPRLIGIPETLETLGEENRPAGCMFPRVSELCPLLGIDRMPPTKAITKAIVPCEREARGLSEILQLACCCCFFGGNVLKPSPFPADDRDRIERRQGSRAETSIRESFRIRTHVSLLTMTTRKMEKLPRLKNPIPAGHQQGQPPFEGPSRALCDDGRFPTGEFWHCSLRHISRFYRAVFE
jgi:hypothetical protein